MKLANCGNLFFKKRNIISKIVIHIKHSNKKSGLNDSRMCSIGNMVNTYKKQIDFAKFLGYSISKYNDMENNKR